MILHRLVLNLVLGTVLILPSLLMAESLHTALCLFGCPQGSTSQNHLVVRELLVTNNNPDTRLADWVAYRILPTTLGETPKTLHWLPDPFLPPDQTLEPDDYKNAAPAQIGQYGLTEAFSNHPNWSESLYTGNLIPISANLLVGAWRKLALAEIDLTKRSGIPLFVIAGPLFEKKMPPLPNADEPHLVPSGYWKLVARLERGVILHEAFVFDQTTSKESSFCSHIVTVAELEARTELKFFPALDRQSRLNLIQKSGVLTPLLGCP